jgi:hypothetical protein
MAALQASIGKLKSEKPAERVSAAQAIAGEDPVPEETEKSAAGKARKTAKKGKSAGTTSAGRSKKSKSSRGAA